MPAIHFDAKLLTIGSHTILRLPRSASAQLPSRGLNMVAGTINGVHFQAPLEPDGKGSHWLKADRAMPEGARAKAGDTVTLAIAPSQAWPEPEVPADVHKALAADPAARAAWQDITPKARWDWLRWIGSTKNPETRKKRIDVTCDKFTKGNRRPCCFNRSQCTDPEVSKNGVLLEPAIGTYSRRKTKPANFR